MTGSKLEIKSLTKVYTKDGAQTVALEATDLTVEKGRFASIIGPSGCGKSTLFNIIAGLQRPTEGTVTSEGADIIGKAGFVGYMLQKDMLLPWRTILDNIILGLEIKKTSKKQAVEMAMPLIEKYGLKGFEDHYPHELSGGMRQRAALLRTLLYDRDIILLDEPFGALDAQTRLSMQDWLLQIWQDFDKTILFVTHDIDEAIYLSDEIFVFTERPGSIKTRLDVDLPRPRDKATMAEPNFLKLKQTLLKLLWKEEENHE